MANDISLGEWLSQAQRSMGGGYFGRASGPGNGYAFGQDFFRKQTYLQVADTFTATYGKKVWDALNNKTVAFNAIKKVDWGPTVGWRLRTDRGPLGSGSTTGGRSRPVTETGALPTIDVSAYTGVYSYPKSIVSTFGVSLKGQAVSALEGGIGNQFAVEQEACSRDHVKEINEELMAGSAYLCSNNIGGNGVVIGGSASTGWGLVKHFKVGDTVSTSGNSDVAATVTSVSTTDGHVHATSLVGADGTTVYIKSRAGVTSLDDICMNDEATVGGDTAGHTLVDVYNLTDRATATAPWAAAAGASYNAGVGRALSTTLIDSGIQTIRQNGGEPKLMITGLDQYDNFNQLLQAQQRFVDVTDYIVGVGDERTYPGTRAGFQLATYRGIPILPDPDTSIALSAADVQLGSNFYILDTDYLEMAVMYPTQYIENRDYFAANALVIRGMFVTMMEMRALRLDVHYKISDLNV